MSNNFDYRIKEIKELMKDGGILDYDSNERVEFNNILKKYENVCLEKEQEKNIDEFMVFCINELIMSRLNGYCYKDALFKTKKDLEKKAIKVKMKKIELKEHKKVIKKLLKQNKEFIRENEELKLKNQLDVPF